MALGTKSLFSMLSPMGVSLVEMHLNVSVDKTFMSKQVLSKLSKMLWSKHVTPRFYSFKCIFMWNSFGLCLIWFMLIKDDNREFGWSRNHEKLYFWEFGWYELTHGLLRSTHMLQWNFGLCSRRLVLLFGRIMKVICIDARNFQVDASLMHFSPFSFGKPRADWASV